MRYHLAIDIGASSGRHILGHIENGKIILEEIYRFDNSQVRRGDYVCWDTERLFSEILAGIKKCAELGKIPESMAIDTWGVDYVLLDGDGELVCDAVAYRDKRTEGAKEELEKILPFERLYEKTGIQYQPFNTIYQLFVQKRQHPEQIAAARHFLMMPEYLNYLLTGVMMNEYTNASTTALLNAEKKTWDTGLLDIIGIPQEIFGTLNMPKTYVGNFTENIRAQAGFDCRVLLAPSHDTASAFLAVPAENDTSVYISSGTWSLLGVENTSPITNKESMQANFSNEGGYEYRFRYLKNIMGLWMLQSIRREMNGVSYIVGADEKGEPTKKYSFDDLVNMAKESYGFDSIVDVDKDVFLAPKSMTEAVKAECERSGQKIPATMGEVVLCVYRSLAKRYAQAIGELETLTGKRYTNINIVGGGCRDTYLNELTSAETGLPVIAGPTEGTALGNLMSQLLAAGELDSSASARDLIRHSFELIKINGGK